MNENGGWVFIEEEGCVKDVGLIGIQKKLYGKLKGAMIECRWGERVGVVVEVDKEVAIWLAVVGCPNYFM